MGRGGYSGRSHRDHVQEKPQDGPNQSVFWVSGYEDGNNSGGPSAVGTLCDGKNSRPLMCDDRESGAKTYVWVDPIDGPLTASRVQSLGMAEDNYRSAIERLQTGARSYQPGPKARASALASFVVFLVLAGLAVVGTPGDTHEDQSYEELEAEAARDVECTEIAATQAGGLNPVAADSYACRSVTGPVVGNITGVLTAAMCHAVMLDCASTSTGRCAVGCTDNGFNCTGTRTFSGIKNFCTLQFTVDSGFMYDITFEPLSGAGTSTQSACTTMGTASGPTNAALAQLAMGLGFFGCAFICPLLIAYTSAPTDEADKEMESICKRLTKESHGEQTWTFWSKKDSVKSKSDEGGRNRYAHKCVICKGPGAAAAQLQMGNATYVVVAIATLRDGPSTKAKKVGELHVGAQVTAIAALEMDGHQRIQISATPPQWASTVVNTGKALMELVPTQQESVQQESVVNPVHESNGMQTVQMTCPAGCGPGSSIQAEINGTMMSLTVPEGVTGGQPFQVQVTAPAED